MKLTLTPRTLFSLLVLVFFGYLVWEAGQWRLQARLYPLAIGIPMIALAVINIVEELRGPKKEAASNTPVDFQLTQTVERPWRSGGP